MTATEFTALAIGWVGAVGTVAGVAIPAYFKIKGQIDALKAKDAAQQKTIDANTSAVVDLHATVEQHADAIVTPEQPARPEPLPAALTK